jgi:hypothetical protein
MVAQTWTWKKIFKITSFESIQELNQFDRLKMHSKNPKYKGNGLPKGTLIYYFWSTIMCFYCT